MTTFVPYSKGVFMWSSLSRDDAIRFGFYTKHTFVSTLIALLHHRWSPPILAELHRQRGSRFVALASRLGLSRESLRRTLASLLAAGLVERNPGYGHPLRPEYRLTPKGSEIAPRCLELLAALEALDAQEIGLKKWSLPVLRALDENGHPARFSELRAALPGVTSRALALALKELVAAGLIERAVTGDFPPATLYRPTPRAAPLVAVLRTF
jgi:DNA-binding HxlR family transcriptional regulator